MIKDPNDPKTETQKPSDSADSSVTIPHMQDVEYVGQGELIGARVVLILSLAMGIYNIAAGILGAIGGIGGALIADGLVNATGFVSFYPLVSGIIGCVLAFIFLVLSFRQPLFKKGWFAASVLIFIFMLISFRPVLSLLVALVAITGGSGF